MKKIQILNSSDSKGSFLFSVTRTALLELKINIPVTTIDNPQDLEKLSDIRKPALVIDDKVIFQGRVPAISELKEIFKKELNEI